MWRRLHSTLAKAKLFNIRTRNLLSSLRSRCKMDPKTEYPAVAQAKGLCEEKPKLISESTLVVLVRKCRRGTGEANLVESILTVRSHIEPSASQGFAIRSVGLGRYLGLTQNRALFVYRFLVSNASRDPEAKHVGMEYYRSRLRAHSSFSRSSYKQCIGFQQLLVWHDTERGIQGNIQEPCQRGSHCPQAGSESRP